MNLEARVEKPMAWGERFFALWALFYGSTAFIRLLLGSDELLAVGDEVLASPIKRILWPMTYLLASYFLLKHGWSSLRILKKMPLLLLLLVYLAASISWSGSRTISILSVGALVGNTLIGIYFGLRYRLAEFLRLLGWVYALITLASLFARVVMGSRALDEGFWLGFFAQKNALGMNMLIGCMVFLMLARRPKANRKLHLAFAALCVDLIFLSGSATCELILFVLIAMRTCQAFLERWIVSTWRRVLLSALLAGSFVTALFSNWDAVLSVLGRSEDLTGRLGLWAGLIWMAGNKPLLGYGYGGFWILGGPAQQVWDLLRVNPVDLEYAHNGYLQMLMDGGLVGVFLMLALLFSALRRAWIHFAATRDFWPLYFFSFLALHNLAEGTFAVRNNICWLLFIAILVQLTRAHLVSLRSPILTAKLHPSWVHASSART